MSRRWLWGVLAVALAMSIPAALSSDASPAVALLFCTSFVAVAAAAFAGRRSYVFAFLAFFLVLGFWLKFVALTLLHIRLLEPIGTFTGSRAEWDSALLAATAGAAGLLAARIAEIALRWRVPRLEIDGTNVPSWYARHRLLIWVSLATAMLLLTAVNFGGAFFQTGVNPKFVLPFHLNVVAAWLVQTGMGLFVTLPVWWELQRRKPVAAMQAPLGEGFITSVSTLSRNSFLIHVLPYALVLCSKERRAAAELTPKRIGRLLVATAVAFSASLVIVSAARVFFFPPVIVEVAGVPAAVSPAAVAAPAPAARTAPAQVAATQSKLTRSPLPPTVAPPADSSAKSGNVTSRFDAAADQLVSMITGRWIGIEGVMAMSAAPGRSSAMLLSVLAEDPRLGLRSTFQRVAASPYRENPDFTFMTIPGFIAVLTSSGSYLLIAAGSFFVGGLLIFSEWVMRRLRFNPFFIAYAGCALANAACQMNFAYLALVFLLQTWIAVFAIAGAMRILSASAAGSRKPAVVL